ncbi:MAG: hypothetical protein RLY71_2550 [Pseudomonadota bacterium]|jgi:DNA polymerase III delta prime subunit
MSSGPIYQRLDELAQAADILVQERQQRQPKPPAGPPAAVSADPPAKPASEAPRPPATNPDGVLLLRGSEIRPEPIAWLWSGWLACGKLHLLAGAPGQGKTTLALALAASVTTGGRWPDGSRCPVGNVLIWSGEDDPADTLLPRLMAMGADRERVYFVSGARIDGEEHPFDPARDLVQLAAAVEQIGDVRLMVVDPIVSAVAGDSHKNTEVRRSLQPLVDLAAVMRAAVVGITHLSKGTAGRDPTERVTGSIAFTAVVRVVLLAAKVKGENGEDRRILVRSKSNIGPDDGGFEYHLEQGEAAPGIPASLVTWGRSIDGSARELLREAEAEADDTDKSAREIAEGWLAELLAGGPISSKQIQTDAKDSGLSWATVRRAADALEVARQKDGLRGGWYWRLPEGAQDSSKVLTQKVEHLRDNLSTFGPTDADGEVL